MIIVENRELEVLRHRMGERDVTLAEVHRYLFLNHAPNVGQIQQPFHLFITDADLVSFWQLVDWWAPTPDKPATLPVPSIVHFAWNINHAPNIEPVTFMDAMRLWYNRAVQWLQSVDRDVANPGESKEDRERRRNRERMAKTRSHRSPGKKVLKQQDPQVQAQVAELEGYVTQLKQDAEDTDALLLEETKRHQAAMEDAAKRRKEAAQDFKERIQKLRTEINSLIAKQ